MLQSTIVLRVAGDQVDFYREYGYKARLSTHKKKPCTYVDVQLVSDHTVMVDNYQDSDCAWLLNASEVRGTGTAQVVCSLGGNRLRGMIPQRKDRGLAHFSVPGELVIVEATHNEIVNIFHIRLLVTRETVTARVEKLFPIGDKKGSLAHAPQKYKEAAKAAVRLAKQLQRDPVWIKLEKNVVSAE